MKAVNFYRPLPPPLLEKVINQRKWFQLFKSRGLTMTGTTCFDFWENQVRIWKSAYMKAAAISLQF